METPGYVGASDGRGILFFADPPKDENFKDQNVQSFVSLCCAPFYLEGFFRNLSLGTQAKDFLSPCGTLLARRLSIVFLGGNAQREETF